MKILTNIQECAVAYATLLNKNYVFKIEGNITFEIKFSTSNFHHLLGLHKLKDLPRLLNLKPKNVYAKILSGEISAEFIEKSVHYPKIADRIKYFEHIFDVLNKEKCKIIIDFDSSKVQNCKLSDTKYILYFEILRRNYFLLTLGQARRNIIYPETIMFEPSAKYNSEQTLLDVYDIQVLTKNKSRG